MTSVDISAESQSEPTYPVIDPQSENVINRRHKRTPRSELDDLATLSVTRGFGTQTAGVAAEELSERDAFTADVDVELGIDPDASPNPCHLAIASAIACPLGVVIPIVAILLLPSRFRVFVPFGAVFVLVLAGAVSAVLERHRRGFVSGTVGFVSRLTLSTETPVSQSGICPVKPELGGVEEAKTIAGETIPGIELVPFIAAPVRKMAIGLFNLPCELSHRCG